MHAKLLSFFAALLFALTTTAQAAKPSGLVQVRKEFAQAVYAGSGQWVHRRQPQSMLRAVVVLNIKLTVDNKWEASVLRANTDQPEMTERAIETVKRARIKAPIPSTLRAELMRDGFMETWLFDRDGSFQVKTLAKPQRRR